MPPLFIHSSVKGIDQVLILFLLPLNLSLSSLPPPSLPRYYQPSSVVVVVSRDTELWIMNSLLYNKLMTVLCIYVYNYLAHLLLFMYCILSHNYAKEIYARSHPYCIYFSAYMNYICAY